MKRFCLFFVLLLTTYALHAQVKVVAPINPNSPLDLYPTHIDSLGFGGFMVVRNIAVRDNIPALRRKQGMLVYVVSVDSIYQLTGGIVNNNWNGFKLGSASGITWWGSLAVAPVNPQLNWGYYNSTDAKSYLYSISGATGTPAWNVIASNDALGQIIPGTRVFPDTVRFPGGVPQGVDSIVSGTNIQTNIDPREYLTDELPGGLRPPFRRYVLGIDNNGMIRLVRPLIQVFSLRAEFEVPRGGITVAANSDYDIDVEFTSILPSLRGDEPVPMAFQDLDITSGPFVSVKYFASNYEPDHPPSSTAVGLPSGIVIAWSAVMYGTGPSAATNLQARYARVRLRNVSASPVFIPANLQLVISAFGVTNGSGPAYLSDLPIGGE